MVGCDGARSIVRTSIGRELRGDSANHAWGVMDVLAVTDFPDYSLQVARSSPPTMAPLSSSRGKAAISFRLYIELAKLETGERVASRNITRR